MIHITKAQNSGNVVIKTDQIQAFSKIELEVVDFFFISSVLSLYCKMMRSLFLFLSLYDDQGTWVRIWELRTYCRGLPFKKKYIAL